MDFSQLPKMSKTPPIEPPPGDPVTVAQDVMPVSDPEVVAAPRHVAAYPSSELPFSYGSVWISLIAGLIFLAMGQTFGRYLAATMAHREFVTGWLQADGVTPVNYFELAGGTAWSDMGLFLMGIVLLLDAAVMLLWVSRRQSNRTLVLLTVALTAIAILINVGVVFYLFSLGIMPLISLVALLVGGFVVFDHAPMLRKAR